MVNNVNAQQWLDEKYPINGICQRNNDSENKGKKRDEITTLNLGKGKLGTFYKEKTLIGSLRLENFTNLRKLIVSSHQLIGLDVSNCPNLEELDCHSNGLANLITTNCSNLEKINCSNNHLRELDLSTCPNLSEVDINNCPKLVVEKIISCLNHDTLSGKLIRSSSVVTLAQEDDIRNILVVGITGNGKSALANSLSDTADFTEKALGVSITKSFQTSEIFEWQGKRYRIIDNIGFADTKNIAEEDILFKIGEGIHSAKEGINQVLFVFRGRFAPEQIRAYNLFKKFIAESRITAFTTLVRTHFDNFENEQTCQNDKQTLLNESKELREIINSCNGIIYVDNPALPVIKVTDSEEIREEKEEEIAENKEIRSKSRQIVLDYLVANCHDIYKLKEWNSIYAMVDSYIKRKEEIEKSDISNKDEQLKQEWKEVTKGIKANIGLEVPGLPVGLTAGFEHVTTLKK